MSEDTSVDPWDTPRIEVRVYRHGELVQRELCDSEEEAARVVDGWAEHSEVTCEVDDLTLRHGPEDVLAPDPALMEEDER
ncbi:MAG TPA: hypothetical protein PLP61_09355 [Nocardioides sp.]|uniref:hypothetical protein n=1 Tax=Nocardioides sp. TaxID=35761 RepID=UPI002C51CAF3|nr:hypothetical protein [Nocardioides sp.]HQR27231.1 hypothetical protein [Nocardioides sp.]